MIFTGDSQRQLTGSKMASTSQAIQSDIEFDIEGLANVHRGQRRNEERLEAADKEILEVREQLKTARQQGHSDEVYLQLLKQEGLVEEKRTFLSQIMMELVQQERLLT